MRVRCTRTSPSARSLPPSSPGRAHLETATGKQLEPDRSLVGRAPSPAAIAMRRVGARGLQRRVEPGRSPVGRVPSPGDVDDAPRGEHLPRPFLGPCQNVPGRASLWPIPATVIRFTVPRPTRERCAHEVSFDRLAEHHHVASTQTRWLARAPVAYHRLLGIQPHGDRFGRSEGGKNDVQSRSLTTGQVEGNVRA